MTPTTHNGTEKQPSSSAWTRDDSGFVPRDHNTIAVSRWTKGPYIAISDLLITDMPDGDGQGPQWHLSVSKRGKRIRDPKMLRRVLGAFGMANAEEDNHEPGEARNFWLPVDPSRRVDCECKVDEPMFTAPNGQVWSANQDREVCGGCTIQAIYPDRRCPLHEATPQSA